MILSHMSDKNSCSGYVYRFSCILSAKNRLFQNEISGNDYGTFARLFLRTAGLTGLQRYDSDPRGMQPIRLYRHDFLAVFRLASSGTFYQKQLYLSVELFTFS